MFNIGIFLYLFKHNNSFYKEVEGIVEPSDKQIHKELEIELGKHYWFELDEERYFFHFGKTPQTHENPYILYVVVPKAKSEDWPNLDNDELLQNAFEYFHKNSAFISLLPNGQYRNFYAFSVKINKVFLYLQVKLGNKPLFRSENFQLKKLTKPTVLPSYMEIGTIVWNSFYKTKISHYGIFMKTYYIAYHGLNKNLEPVVFFRVGVLGKLAYVVFKLNFEDSSIFLNDDDSFVIEFIQNFRPFGKNNYRLWKYIPDKYIDIEFCLEVNINQQFQVVFGNVVPKEEIKMPAIKRLSQAETKVYLLREDDVERVTIEAPVYFFGQELAISKMVVQFKIIIELLNKSPKVESYLKVYDFNQENVCITFYTSVVYALVNFKYFIEDENIAFVITKVTSSGFNDTNLVPTETTKTIDVTKKEEISTFLNGAVFYDKESAVTLTSSDMKKQQTKPNSKTLSKHSNRNAILYLSISFVMLLICFFITFFFPCLKKKAAKKQKFRKIKSR